MNETLVQAYYDYMVDIAVLFGADKAQAKEQLLQSLEFEMALANVCSTRFDCMLTPKLNHMPLAL